MWPRILHGVRKEGGEPIYHAGCMQQRLWTGRPPAETRSARLLARSQSIGEF